MEETTTIHGFDANAIAGQISELTSTVSTLGTAAIGIALALAAFGLVFKLVRRAH